ncbi:MAG: cysteine desulfurase family protein [Lachnospiraceae bacterium]
MEIYLDNGATTRVLPEVRDEMVKVLMDDYGNPSAMHTKGVEAEKYLKNTRKIIADSLKVDIGEIYFTSGGTEGNNIAIIGTALANQRAGKHLITTKVEHASVSEAFYYLESIGFEVTYLPVDGTGAVSLEKLREAIREDTILVSIMCVNNEIGTIEPVQEIAKIIKEKNKKTLFHVDAVQAYGKIHLYPKRWNIDLMTISGHKIHAPKGTGALFIRQKVKVKPLVYGGHQERGMRSGTENVPGIAGLGVAVKWIQDGLEERSKKIREIKEYFISSVMEIENLKNNSGEAPHIASISFRGVRSEVLLHALEERNIYVSAGAACSNNKKGTSNTLVAIGLTKEEKESTLRFTFSSFNTKEQVDEVVKVLKELIPMLRRFTRR